MPEFRKVVRGFLNFRESTYKQNEALFRQLARKQEPKVMVIACCDSRVDPAIVTNAEQGDLFVLRNVANLVPPCERQHGPTRHGTSAALEFAVTGLQVKYIIVLGHSGCGGIRALLTSDPSVSAEGSFIYHWMQIAREARERTLADKADAPLEEQLRYCEQQGIRQSLDNLMTFPWVQERVAAGTLSLHGWYFDIGDGKMYYLEPETGRFEELVTVPTPQPAAG